MAKSKPAKKSAKKAPAKAATKPTPRPKATVKPTASAKPAATPAARLLAAVGPASGRGAAGLTLAHVTHEAVEQIGGIGTVLEGLITSPVYQKHVGRTILVGPTQTHLAVDPAQRLGEHGQVLYSSIDGVDKLNLGGKLRPIEWAFNVSMVYGRRTFNPPGQGRKGEAEVLLIDCFRINHDRLNVFKLRLWERFGIDSGRYEKSWDFEEYARLAEPAYYALLALLHERELPCVLFSHEFMGMPAALQAIMDGHQQFRTVFHAHECATARRLVEDHVGHDTMFYNVLDRALDKGLDANQVFGDLDAFFRHALISRAHLCDGVIAVGDRTRDELRFLSRAFREHPIEVVYNGLPANRVTLQDKLEARAMLQDYSQALLGYRPDVLISHVTRPVISKGLWRDLQVCHHLDGLLAERGQTGVLYILTSGGGVRRPQDVTHMEKTYAWPRFHREGYPDLVGPEVDLNRMIEPFNAEHKAMQVVLVNQFGWSRDRIGQRLPADMHIGHFRTATDAEFGMATYEPFGISPLEPLGAGAVCVISTACGCEGFVRHVTAGGGTPNVISADYTQVPDAPSLSLDQLRAIGQPQRDAVEQRVAADIARELVARLPATDADRKALIDRGQKLVGEMGWDQVIEEALLPMLHRIVKSPANHNGG